MVALPRFLLLACVIGSAIGGFPTSTTLTGTRAFFSSPHGQVHYVHNLDTHKGTPLVMFHSHPRSVAEFKYMLEALPDTPYVAFDYFGFGSSDACQNCDPDKDEYVSIEQFAQYAQQVLTQLGATRFVPFGALKGASIASRLAATATGAEALILVGPGYWFPDVEAKIRSYLNMLKHPVIKPDGSHLLGVWNDTSSNPMPDLDKMEEKTVDELRAYFTGWQYVLSELDNNNNTLPDLRQFSKKSLLFWGGVMLQEFDAFNFHAAAIRAKIEGALADAQIHEFEYGNQGMVAANGTEVAGIVAQFMKTL